MHDDQDPLLKACFELCAATMWEPDRLNAQQVIAHMQELDEMTNDFYAMARNLQNLLGDVADSEKIMVSAVIYLKDSHAIPPLRGNLDWFKNSLMTLVELINPQNAIRKSNFVFISYIQQGLLRLATNVLTDDDLDEFSQV